jgi:SNF2 family DNA or RNA helicase
VELYPYQKDGVLELTRRRCIILADEMGLGKTVQAAVALRNLFAQGAVSRAVIACPSALTRNWVHEIRSWAPELNPVLYEGLDRHGLLMGGARILVTSIETLSNDLTVSTRNGTRFTDIGVDLLILDEAQRIKGFNTTRALILSKIIAARRWAITGTPLENRPQDLASIIRFLQPNEFAEGVGVEDHERLLSLRDSLMVRRSRKSVGLGLPPKSKLVQRLGLSPAQESEYELHVQTLLDSIRGAPPSGSGMSLLAALQDLRRIALVSKTGESAKLDTIEQEISEMESDAKVVLFTSFPNLIFPLAQQRLQQFGCVMFTGEMPAALRQEAHERFINDPTARIMLASLRAAGVGLTWTVASFVYHLDVWWNPQAALQAEDRVYRIGQTAPVTVKQLVSIDTIEEAVLNLQDTKRDIFDMLINDNVKVGEAAFTRTELLSLIGLKRN